MSISYRHRASSSNKQLTEQRKQSKNSQDIKKKLKLIACHKPKYHELEFIQGEEYAPVNQFTSGTTVIRALEHAQSKKRAIAFVRKEGKDVEIVDATRMPSVWKMATAFETPVADQAEAIDLCMRKDLTFISVEIISHKARQNPEAQEESDE